MPVQENASRFIRQSCLLEILQKYGAVTPVGSYRMQVMVWNDLDLYMDTADLTPDKYYRLTAELVSTLRPIRFDGLYNAEQEAFFIGLETVYEHERWNIDIWWKSKAETAACIARSDELVQRMQHEPGLKQAVIAIKQGLIDQKLYGFDKAKKHFHSSDIYDAVFGRGILTAEEFLAQYK